MYLLCRDIILNFFFNRSSKKELCCFEQNFGIVELLQKTFKKNIRIFGHIFEGSFSPFNLE
jgi:hypothetical protein